MSLSSKVNYSLEALSGITVGNINITGNIFQNNNPYIASQWTSTSGNALTYTSGNVIISSGSLLVSALTTGNINFTGTLYQNGSPYVGSQWTTTTGNLLTYTSGNVLISNGTISASGATAGILYSNSSRVGINTTSPLLDLDIRGSSFGLRLTDTSPNDHLYFQVTATSSLIRAGGADSGLSIDVAAGSASQSYGNQTYTRVATFTSRGNVGIGNTSPSFNLDVTGTGQITTSLTTGALYSTNQTTTNIVATSSTITNLSVPGTLTVVNITSTNLIDTTISAGTLVATSASVGNLSAVIGTISNMLVSNNTVSNSFISGGLGIGTTNPNTSYRLDVAGSIRSGLRVDIGGTQPIYNNNTLGKLFITGAQNSVPNGPNILITTAQDAFPTYNFLTYGHDSSWTMYDMYFDGSSFRNSATNTAFMMVKENSTLKWNYNSVGFSAGAPATMTTSICIGSGGNIGLGGQVTPAYTLDVSGGARIVSGISAGSSVVSDLYLSSPTNATNVSSGGALTVAGGAAVGGDLIVGGSVIYSNAASVSSSFAYLTLTGTDLSTDVGNGALVAFGGISVQTTENALSATSGSGLTIGGGAGIGKDLYVGGKSIVSGGITAGSSTFTSVSAGNSQFSNLSTGNINFTGNLFQNGSAYIGSQWNGTSGSIYYGTAGSSTVGINTTNPGATLDVSGTGRITTSLTTGALYSVNQTTTNIVGTRISAGNFAGTTISTTNMYASTGTISNLVGTSISASNINVSGTLTVVNITSTNLVDTTISASTIVGTTTSTANIYGSLGTVSNFVGTNISSSTLSGTSGTVGNFVATTSLSTGTLVGTTTSTANIYASLGTVSNFAATASTITSAVITNVSSSNMYTTILTSGNVYVTDTTVAYGFSGAASIISAGGASFRNMWLAGGAGSSTGSTPNQFTPLVLGWNSGNPQIAFQRGDGGANTVIMGVNTQAQFYLQNNSGVSSGGLFFQTSNARPMYFTGGNVGIGTSNPGYALDVTGTGNFTTSITTGALYSTNQTTTNIVATASTITNLSVPGTLTVVNITSTNLVETNITATTIIITGGSLNATFNSNTIGSIITTSSGNVGIGTTSPGAALDISGNLSIQKIGYNAVGPTLRLLRAGANYGGAIWVSYYSNIGDDIMAFGIGNNSEPTNSSNIKMIIRRDGLIGMGTSNPAFNLDVNGTTRVVSGLTSPFNSNTVGNIFTTGGNVGINITTPAFGLDVNGTINANNSLSIGGGISSFFAGSFSANNNVSSATNVTGLLFPSASVRSFLATLTINLSKSGGNLNEMVTLEGIQRDSGWSLFDTALGEDTGLVFTIDSTGQVKYTSTNYTGWVSTTIRFEGHYYTIAGTYIPTALPTTGNVAITGDLSISSTKDATNTSSGALTISGGAGVSKSLLVGQNLNVGGVSNTFTGSFAAANNVAAATNVTGFLVPTATFSSFTASINVRLLTTTTTLNAQYLFEATQTTSGWLLNDTAMGDSVDITFTITSDGQIQYTSTNVANWQSTTINYSVTAISISTGFTAVLPTSGSVTISGNLTIDSTTDSSSTSSASLVLAGGAGINKSLLVGGNFNIGGVTTQFAGTFSAANGASGANFTGLSFPNATIRSFSCTISIRVVSNVNYNTQHTIDGIQTATGGWQISDSQIGDASGITFAINSSGQITYTSPTFTSWTSTTMHYNAVVYNISSSYTPIPMPTGGSSSVAGSLVIQGTDPASSTSSGSLSVSGGVNIQKNLIVGNDITATGLTSSNAQITNANITNSTIATLVNTNTITTNITSSSLSSTSFNLAGQNVFKQNFTASSNSGITITIPYTKPGNWILTYIRVVYMAESGDSAIRKYMEYTGKVKMLNASVDFQVIQKFGQNNIPIYCSVISTSSNVGNINVQLNAVSPSSAINVYVEITSTNATFYTGTLTTSATTISDNAFYDDALSINTLGVGTLTPGTTLDVSGTGRITTSLTTGALYSTNLTSTNIGGTTMTVTNAVFTNISSGTLNLSTGLTSASSQITNMNTTTLTAATLLNTTSFSAIGNSNTLGNIYTTGGNVGIGNTSPLYKLDVNGVQRIYSGNGVQLAFSTANGNFSTIESFTAGNTAKLPLCLNPYGGNVGIGTTAPAALFTVNGNITITPPDAGSNMGVQFFRSGIADWYMYNPSGSSNLRFYNSGDRMTLTASGNVGVGTIAPGYKLEVSQDNTGAYPGDNTTGQIIISGATDSSKRFGFQLDTVRNFGHIQVVKAGSTTYPLILNGQGGNVGVNTTNPGYTLDVAGVIRGINGTTSSVIINGDAAWGQIELYGTNGAYIDFKNNSGDDYDARIQNLGSNNSLNFHMNAAANIGMSLTSAGTLLISGDIGAFASISDRRLKTNVTDISPESALETVKTLRPVTFNWKDDIFNQARRGEFDSGFIAQEVEEVIPHAVGEYTTIDYQNTYKNMRHERIIPYLVGSIQKLEGIITELNTRIEYLESK